MLLFLGRGYDGNWIILQVESDLSLDLFLKELCFRCRFIRAFIFRFSFIAWIKVKVKIREDRFRYFLYSYLVCSHFYVDSYAIPSQESCFWHEDYSLAHNDFRHDHHQIMVHPHDDWWTTSLPIGNLTDYRLIAWHWQWFVFHYGKKWKNVWTC